MLSCIAYILSYITTAIFKFQISVGRLLSLFHANYKVKYNLCEVFIRCLDGALLRSEVNALNSSGSDPGKNVDTSTTVVTDRSTWNKNEG